VVQTLDELATGQRARIVDVAGDDALATRILEMGLTDGEEICLLGRAPLGDPLEFLVRGYRVSLRASEARRVSIEPLA
jgi:ferrous iron transport protein A